MDNPFRLSENSAQLTDILNTLGEGFGFIDKEENFLFVNQVAADIFGYTKEELTGTNLSNYLTEAEFSKILEQNINRREGKTTTYDLTIIRKDGSHRQIQSTVSPLFENGNFIGSYGIIRDFTESAWARDRLAESEKRFRTVSDVISDFAVSFIITPDNAFVPEWHSGMLPLQSTYDTDIILEFNTWIETCHPDDLPVLKDALARIMKEREPVTFEYRIITGEQTYEWFELIANPELEPNSNRIGKIIVAGKNITEKKNSELTNQLTFTLMNAVNLAATIPDIFSAIRKELGQYFDCSNLSVSLVKKEPGLCDTYFQHNGEVVSEQESLSVTLNPVVIDSRKPVLLNHIGILKLEEQGIIHPSGNPIKGWAGIPLLIGDEVIGVISVSSFEKENFLSSRHFAMLRHISSHIALTIRRKQDEVALKTSESQLRESNMSKEDRKSVV